MADDPKWVTHEWLDGPGFVKWARKRGLLPDESHPNRYVPPNMSKRLYEWETLGRKASIFVVDKLLFNSGYHFCDLPDELWTSPPKKWRDGRGNRGYFPPAAPETRQEAIRRVVDNGEAIAVVARELGVSERSVRNWKKKELELRKAVAA